MRKILIVLVILGTAACSGINNSAGYSAELQSWIGRSEYQLYNSWGQPANVFYVTPYEKVVTYITTSASGSNTPYNQQLYYQGMGDDNSWWDDLFGPPGTGRQPKIYYCKTSFTIQNAIIVNFNFNGDDCVYNN